MANRTIQIAVGTNEHYLLGYSVTTKENGKLSFTRTFAERAHAASIRSVSIGGRFLVTGAADEMIKVFDLHKNTHVGIIEKHQGTITALAFHKKYLFSGSEDGNICIYKANNWKCEKTLNAHVGGVTGLAVHPSGKVALSVGRDKTLKTWNLIKGRRAFITNLKTVADAVYWMPAGTRFLVVKGSCVDIYEVETCTVLQSVDFKEVIHALTFVTDDIIAVGGEGKNICLYDTCHLMELQQWPAHTMRIKSICRLPRPGTDEIWLASASSDGIVKVWRLEMLSIQEKPKLLGQVSTSCRIICMAVSKALKVKLEEVEVKEEKEVEEKAQDEEEVEEEEEEEDVLEMEDDEVEAEEDSDDDSEDDMEANEETGEKDEDSDSQESFLDEDELAAMEADIEEALSQSTKQLQESAEKSGEKSNTQKKKKKKQNKGAGKDPEEEIEEDSVPNKEDMTSKVQKRKKNKKKQINTGNGTQMVKSVTDKGENGNKAPKRKVINGNPQNGIKKKKSK